jgi:rSAM/selenodomain-associated transferase 1
MRTVLVLAKEPRPGAVKTRLCPPRSPTEAARLAEASLRDTLEVVLAAHFDHRVLVLEGGPGPWLPPGFAVVPQRSGDLGQRLDHAFAIASLPALLIGMDTPQVTRAQLDHAWARLSYPTCDAVLGPAADGGYWSIGLKHRVVGAFDSVPMSTSTTFAAQRDRLVKLGLRVTTLGVLRDVDRYCDAVEVACMAPGTRFARAVHELTSIDA